MRRDILRKTVNGKQETGCCYVEGGRGRHKGQKLGTGNGRSETFYRSKVSGQEIGDRRQERGIMIHENRTT
jgi:hypothetical protein